MTTFLIFKRYKEADTYQCGKCATLWKEEWVERHGRDKNVITCPFCHEYFDAGKTDVKRLKRPVVRNKRIKKLVRRKVSLEANLEEMNRSLAERSGMSAVNERQVALIGQLRQVNEFIDLILDRPPPTWFPTTMHQNCLSAGVTIKPQIDWREFDVITV